MRLLRGLLAVIWVLFGLTATAHAMPHAMVQTKAATSHAMTMAMDTASHHTSDSDQGIMPCCNQPVLIVPDAPFVPLVRKVAPLSLAPSPALPLIGLVPPAETRPPKTV